MTKKSHHSADASHLKRVVSASVSDVVEAPIKPKRVRTTSAPKKPTAPAKTPVKKAAVIKKSPVKKAVATKKPVAKAAAKKGKK